MKITAFVLLDLAVIAVIAVVCQQVFGMSVDTSWIVGGAVVVVWDLNMLIGAMLAIAGRADRAIEKEMSERD